MNSEIKLGLCDPPEPIFLYVKNGELSGESLRRKRCILPTL
jgi:hypothetical protein